MRLTPRQFLLLSLLCTGVPMAMDTQNAQAQGGTAQPNATIVALPLDLQSIIDDAKAKKLGKVTIQPGTYRITSDTVKLNGMSDFVLDGTGATLLFPNPKAWAFSTMECTNVIFRGFTLDYDPIPFTQATITEKSADGTVLNFRIHDGFPRLKSVAYGRQCHAFDKTTRNWKVGVGDLYGDTEIIDDTNGKVTFPKAPSGMEKLNVGDYLVFNSRGSGAIDFKDSKTVRLEDVTLLTSPGLGVSGRHMEGDNYFRYTIKRGPRLPGATEDRLLSTGADGFNYADTRYGPTLEKCDFSFMGDDSVNLHGRSWPVLKIEGNAIWTASFIGPRRFDDFLPGDEIRFMSPDNFKVRSTGKLAVWEHNVPANGIVITPELWKQTWPQRAVGNTNTFYKIVLDKPVDVKVGDFFDFPAANSPNYVIRDNYFHDHRARGLRIQSPDGLIENNRFERLKGSAIAIGPELVYWREAGWPKNVIIRGNTIKDVGEGTNIMEASSFTPGAISLYSRIERPDANTFSQEIRDIQIVDNVIDGSSVAGIHVNAAQNVMVRGNRISNVNKGATAKTGSDFKLNSAEPITVQNSGNVRVESNTIVKP